jgi:hypothetical protein
MGSPLNSATGTRNRLSNQGRYSMNKIPSGSMNQLSERNMPGRGSANPFGMISEAQPPLANKLSRDIRSPEFEKTGPGMLGSFGQSKAPAKNFSKVPPKQKAAKRPEEERKQQPIYKIKYINPTIPNSNSGSQPVPKK